MKKPVNVLLMAALLCGAVLLTGCPDGPFIPDNGDDDDPDDPIGIRPLWAKRAGGPTGDVAQAVTCLDDGSSFVTGYFSASAIFSPATQQEVAWASAGDNDIFVAKYTPEGQLSWVAAAGGSGKDEGHAVSVLPDGSFYVAGAHSLLAAFGVRDPVQQILPSAGLLDVFLARFNADGSFRFATRAGGYNHDEANDVSATANGVAYVTGYFTDQAGFGVAESNETVLTAAGAQDLFIARYKDDGTLDWAKRAGDTGADVGLGVAAYADGSAVVAGYFDGPFKNDGTAKQLARDFYIAKYDVFGTRLWFRKFGGSGDTAAEDVAPLLDGGCIVVGGFTGTVTFGQGEPNQTTLSAGTTRDAFFARFASDGKLVWVRRASSPLGESLAYAVSAYGNGAFIAGGYFTRRTTFGPGETAEVELAAVDGQDLFVARFDVNGDLIAVSHGGGTGDAIALGLAIAPEEEFLVAGAYNGPLTIGVGSSSPIALNTTFGGWDILVARLAE